MIVLNVFASLKSEQESAFLEEMKGLVAASRAEAGNDMYSLYKQTDAENEYIIVEHWKDQAAIDTHNATPHFQSFIAKVNDFVKAPLRIETYPA